MYQRLHVLLADSMADDEADPVTEIDDVVTGDSEGSLGETLRLERQDSQKSSQLETGALPTAQSETDGVMSHPPLTPAASTGSVFTENGMKPSEARSPKRDQEFTIFHGVTYLGESIPKLTDDSVTGLT